METVTYQEFRHRTGEAVLVLSLVIIVALVNSFKYGFSYEYIGILIGSFLSLVFLSRLLLVAEKFIETGENTVSKKYLLEFGIIIILSVLSFYLFFVKGVYAIILVLKNFSFNLFLKKLLIIIISYRLVFCTSKIQTVLRSLRQKNPNKYMP
jgi:hypothetical protein